MPDEDYDDIIGVSVLAAAGAGPLIVVPFADPAAMTAIWTTMTVTICRRAGHEIDREAAGRLAVAVGAGIGAYYAGSKLLGSALSKIPVTMAPTIAANVVLNALYTLRLGNALVDLMEKDDFQLSDWEYVVSFLAAALAPRPTAAEIRRVKALLDRLRGRLAG